MDEPTYEYSFTLTPHDNTKRGIEVSAKFFDRSHKCICSKALIIRNADAEYKIAIDGFAEHVEILRRGNYEVDCEKVVVRCITTDRERVFYVRQPIPRNQPLTINGSDPVLPQHDINGEKRRNELERRKKLYEAEINGEINMLVVSSMLNCHYWKFIFIKG